MKFAIIKILLFTFTMILVLTLIFIYIYVVGGFDFPPAYFSNSVSFNEKIEFLKNKDLNKLQIVSVGSSMTLNNINSKIILEDFDKDQYINFGSWGFQISNSGEFLKNMMFAMPNLKYVIISTNLIDFSDWQAIKIKDFNKIRFYLTSKLDLNTIKIPLFFNINYYFKNAATNKARNERKNSYQNLLYDDCGGITLEIDKEHVDKKNWNKDVSDYKIIEKELDSLRSLCNYLHTKNIKLILSYSPVRKGIFTKEKYLTNDIEKIKIIVESKKHIFINSYDNGMWDDSLFVDSFHFNRIGTEIYTAFIMERVFGSKKDD